MKPKMTMTLTIKRSQWTRGVLWDNEQHCGCVLGYYMLAHGADPNALHGCVFPFTYEASNGPLPTAVPLSVMSRDRHGPTWSASEWALDALHANDSNDFEPFAREDDLKAKFAKVGCQLIFTD